MLFLGLILLCPFLESRKNTHKTPSTTVSIPTPTPYAFVSPTLPPDDSEEPVPPDNKDIEPEPPVHLSPPEIIYTATPDPLSGTPSNDEL